MDFSVHGNHQPIGAPAATMEAAGSPKNSRNKPNKFNKWASLGGMIFLIALTVILVASIFLIHYANTNQFKYVNTGEFQAVDVSVGGSSSGDQIYFGQIKVIDTNYLILDDIYYIPATSSSTSNITLQPLVCQVDNPFNQMVINSTSVNWWENLQNNGKVAQSILSYQKQNPKGANCSALASNSTTSTPSASTGTTGTTGSTSTTK
jgi:hypothetical protein